MTMRRKLFDLLGLLCLLALAVPVGPAAAQDQPAKKKKKKMEVAFAAGWDGCYRPRQWTPISLTIRTPFDEPVGCQVRLEARQDALNDLVVTREEVLMPNLRREVPLVTRLDFGTNSASLDLFGPHRRLFGKTYDLWDPYSGGRNVTAVNHWETLIGVTGGQRFSIMDVERASVSTRSGKQGNVYVRYRFPRQLPADWAGYASLDLLVLYDVDYTALSIHQQRAVAQYVSGGGSVLIVMGPRPLPAGSPVARMLPIHLHEPKTIQLARRDLAKWNCVQPKRDSLACWQAEVLPGAEDWSLAGESNGNAYFVRGPVGFGRAGVLLFDPAGIGCRPGTALAAFWVPLMNRLIARRDIRQVNRTDVDNDYSYEFQLGPEHKPTTTVLNHLYEIEQLRPIHIGWVILVLTSLAVLIGPVDYLVLKAAGRLPWTWVTSTACIAAFSVGAYYGVEYIRGGELQAKVVSVVDAVQGGDAWATRYVGIFAPHSDDYKLTDLTSDQWWSGLAPDSDESLYAYNEPDASRSVYCRQHVNGGSVPYSVPINIWSMQSLLCETRLPKAPISATVRHVAGREWSVTIDNPGPDAIAESFAVVDGGREVPCGAVEPGQTKTFTASAENSWSYRNFRHGKLIEAAAGAVGASGRSDAIQSYVDAGAAVVCARFADPDAPVGIEGEDCKVQHVLLARLVVFPQHKE